MTALTPIEQKHRYSHKQAAKLFTYSAFTQRYFEKETGLTDLTGINFLEVGFSQGGLLKWALDCGANAHGIEHEQFLVDVGRQRGIHTFKPDEFVWGQTKFDLIIAFDVFEHISQDELATLLKNISNSLTPSGKLLAKFPNGTSPFGRTLQYASIYHVQVVSASKVRQLIASQSLPLEVFKVRDPAFVLNQQGNAAFRATKTIQHWLRLGLFALIAGVVGLPRQMDQNTVVEVRLK